MGPDDIMETPAGGGTPPSTPRWNPTKEQISMLESLYMEGIRTPSAEQIEEMTNRLKAFGHIEGKNVFYWFQNHKARQRQKQKQDHHDQMLNYFNAYLHTNHNAVSPFFSPHPHTPNVVCSPYYIPQRDQLVFSPNYSCGLKKRAKAQKVSQVHGPAGIGSSVMRHRVNDHQQTLALFPVHPTGILEERSTKSTSSLSSSLTSADNSTATTTTPSSSYETNVQDNTFFDFF